MGNRRCPPPSYATFDGAVEKPLRVLHSHKHAPWYSRLVFAYAWLLLIAGSRRQLDLSDLYDLDHKYRTTTSSNELSLAIQTHANPLHRTIASLYGYKLVWCGVLSFVTEICAVFAPVVLHQVIELFSAASIDTKALLVWILAFFASRLVNGFAYAHAKFQLELVQLQLSSGLKGLLFAKTIRRRLRRRTSKSSPVEVTNLFTADIDSITWATSQLNALWIMPIQITVVFALLYLVLDVAALAGLTVILVSMWLNYLVAKCYNRAFRSVMQFKDERMRAIKEVFSAIHVVKLNAWEHQMAMRIQRLRDSEAAAIARYLYWNGLSIFLFWSAPLGVSIASFAVYSLVLKKELTVAMIFTSMVLFNAIREPLSQFPEALQSLLQARTSLSRMATYLAAEVFDHGVVSHDPTKHRDDVQVQVQDATLSWDASSDKITLHDISLTIHRGDFVVIHGPVGAGKSTLCNALLGEVPITQGRRVFVRPPSVAYYPQQPWIQNMTIRDNILFGLPYNKAKYDTVIDACGLLHDLAVFPAGDLTEIGHKGVNLSGGQKARVCLARACYSNADVVILDSPLAAVDVEVQKEIFAKCVCGILASKTVLLVTHLKEIIEAGVANVIVHVDNRSARVIHAEPTVTRREYAARWAPTALSQHRANDENPPIQPGTLVEEEARQSGSIATHVYLAYIDALGGWPMLAASIGIIATWQCFQVYSDIWLSQWTSGVAVGYGLTVYALLGLGTSVFLLLRSLVMAYTGVRAAQHLFRRMTDALLHAPLRHFDANPIGRVVNRYAEDVSTVDFRLPFAVFRLLVASAVNVFQILAAVYVIHWPGVLIVPLAWLYMKTGFFYLATFGEVTRLTKTTRSPVLSHLVQSEEGAAVLRAHGQSFMDRAIAENHSRNDAFNRAWYAKAIVSQWFAVRVQMIGFGIVALVVLTLVVLRDFMTPGLVGLAFMYAVSIDIRLSWWIDSWSSLEMAMVSAERLVQYSEIEREEKKTVRSMVPLTWPQRGTITFDSVKFAYKPGGDLVLKGLSFDVNHNEKIGIVGRTGAGKSSLTMALFRINELVSGRILLDGVDIATVQLQTLRSKMSIIPQVPVLFKGSLRAYMDPFDEYSDAEIWTAFDKMNMKVMVSALDGKLQHELSENGENFSVGERQMLCLARALLCKSCVVVMDEATASIDRATEKQLQEMIQREFVDATVLTIAHRLATVLESDRILVLSDGKVAEFDTPTALLSASNGVLYRMLHV